MLFRSRLGTEPVPEPGPDEVLVRVTTVGICGSDLHWLEEGSIGDAQVTKPLVLGHEFAGVVASSESSLSRFRVAVDPAIPCMKCEFCLGGNPNLCSDLHFAGHGLDDGALREYMAWPERCLHPLPDSISDEEGALQIGRAHV